MSIHKLRLCYLSKEIALRISYISEALFCSGFKKFEIDNLSKELHYLRNIDIEMHLNKNFRDETNLCYILSFSNNFKDSSSYVLDNDLSLSIEFQNLEISWKTQKIDIFWETDHFTPSNEMEDSLENFVNFELPQMVASPLLRNSLNQNQFEINQNVIQNVELEVSNYTMKDYEANKKVKTIQLPFSVILNLSDNIWFKMESSVDEVISIILRQAKFKDELGSVVLPKFMKEKLNYFAKMQKIYKFNYDLNFFIKRMLIKLKQKNKKLPESINIGNMNKELFMNVCVQQHLDVSQQMLDLSTSLLSENNLTKKILGLTKNDDDLIEYFRNNFSYLSTFSSEELETSSDLTFEQYSQINQTKIISKMENLLFSLQLQIQLKKKLQQDPENSDRLKDDELYKDNGVMVMLRFNEQKDKLILAMKDFKSKTYLVKELKNQSETYLILKKNQFELDAMKEKIKQTIFYSTEEFTTMFEQFRSKEAELQEINSSILTSVNNNIKFFCTFIEKSRRKQRFSEDIAQSKRSSDVDSGIDPDSQNCLSLQNDVLFMFTDIELLDIDFTAMEVVSDFKHVIRDLSVQTLLNRVSSSELSSVTSKLGPLLENMNSSKKPKKDNSSMKEQYKKEGIDNLPIYFKTEKQFLFAFNNGQQQNQLGQEHVSKGIYSKNLYECFKNRIQAVDSKTEIIQFKTLLGEIKKCDLIILHSVEAILSIIPFEDLFNSFLIQDRGLEGGGTLAQSAFSHIVVSDRFPFSRKSFQKQFPLGKGKLVLNSSQYTKQLILLFSLFRAPSIVVGKYNLPLETHKSLLHYILGDQTEENHSDLKRFHFFGLCSNYWFNFQNDF
jgi:hypothetical protein